MLYLFYGPDELARSEAVAELCARVPVDVAELNISRLDGRRLKLETLAAACEAMPFLADQRLVIVSDALKHTKAGKERDELRAYLERVPPSCLLVFVEGEDVDRRSVLFTQLKKSGELREFQPPQGGELVRWVTERARRFGVRLDPPAAQHVIELAGGDPRTLQTELEKLATYVGRKGTITSATVDLLVQDSQEQNLFAFLDELSMRRIGAALRGAHALLEDGQAPTYILFMLARQIRILLGVQELVAQRMRPEAIAAELGQKPFVVRKAIEQARAFGPGELSELHARLLELDLATKTGRIQPETALELFVAETCVGNHSGR
ncbi:DNA polymerase III subunit delta [Candidatus Chloroploca asiatica]|uniref:DNA polymerase III subunit delta n=1 Tax=Candidatus Chloroploca asiatica TaxID=1506545 RepID=A0A2H3KJD0_9CHLR|nr:DNA polymerase III subunit delta [Candidatus Chloroploca asiatica]PDV97968.1 DNA polymerase III subunit delta [Candidatus Chloroploca asiatica]